MYSSILVGTDEPETWRSIWLTATNLSFGSANSIAFGAFGCWASRMMTANPDVCSVKLDVPFALPDAFLAAGEQVHGSVALLYRKD